MSTEKDDKKLHQLKLHEVVMLGGIEITRVPGGWIYSWAVGKPSKGIGLTMCFVPYDDEFNKETRNGRQ